METSSTNHPSIKTYIGIFIALLVLLFVTVAVAEIELGRWSFLAAVLIATVKAMLILLYFMHVRYSPPLTWLFSMAAFFWLAILFVFTLSDYATRGYVPGP